MNSYVISFRYIGQPDKVIWDGNTEREALQSFFDSFEDVHRVSDVSIFCLVKVILPSKCYVPSKKEK